MIEQDSHQPTERSGSGSGSPASRTSLFFAHAPSSTTGALSAGCGKANESPHSTEPSSSSCLPILVHSTAHPSPVSSASSSSPNPPPTLHIRTDLVEPCRVDPSMTVTESGESMLDHRSLSAASLPVRTPNLQVQADCAIHPNSSNSSLSPASVLSSPPLTAVGDVTPLPSPILFTNPGPWKFDRQISRSFTPLVPSVTNLRQPDTISPVVPRARAAKVYPALDRFDENGQAAKPGLTVTQNSLGNESPRDTDHRPPITGGWEEEDEPGSAGALSSQPACRTARASSTLDADVKSNVLHREHYLAVDRGIAVPATRPPIPPRRSSGNLGDKKDEPVVAKVSYQNSPQEIYYVRSIRMQQLRKYRKVCELGQGTFSQVSLAVRVESGNDDGPRRSFSVHAASALHQRLVAVKIVEFGPAGGTDEGRVEVSLKREVDILKSVNHPSLVQLKAFGSDEKRALLVLDYCPGGDLFDFASSPVNRLSPNLIQRIFAELVDAVLYLHRNYIVHRDIKLESEFSRGSLS